MEGTGWTRSGREDAFSSLHPLVSFVYFVLITGCSVFVMHPVFLGISCAGGLGYAAVLRGRKGLFSSLWLMVGVFLVSAALNPLFNHQGVTILFYMSTGNPFTLESVIYGLASGAMLASVLNWFRCYQDVMTSDKFIYLFGKILPAMSLILSMSLRFVSRYKEEIQRISRAQRCIGRDVADGSAGERAKHGMKILSVMTTWALENSVETADSMRGRGYGLRGRTNYSLYRFDGRSKRAFCFIGLTGMVVILSVVFGAVKALYFPALQIAPVSAWSVCACAAYGGLSFFPLVMNILEEIRWRYLRSRI